MKIDAVFEGGGVKGIGLLGAVCCIEERGYEIQNYAGSSAGAMVAALLAAGYKGKELSKIILNMDYGVFLDKRKFKNSMFFSISENVIKLLKDKGIYSGDPIEEYIKELLLRKNKVKFKHISVNGKSPLKIIASDITKGDMLILPDDLVKYDIDPMEFEISKAVRMSISIPFFFKPEKLKHNNEVSYVVDGGILSNYPIWIFDVQGTPKWPTFGMKLVDENKSYPSRKRTDIVSYSLDIISAMLNKNEEIYVKDKDWVRTISIPTLGVGTTDFSLKKEKAKELFQSGYNSAERFIEKWNFESYKRSYR